jgi:hypothetical protein
VTLMQFKSTNCSFLHNCAGNMGGAVSTEFRYDNIFSRTVWVKNFVSNCGSDASSRGGGALFVSVVTVVTCISGCGAWQTPQYSYTQGGSFSLIGNVFIKNSELSSCASMICCLI